MNQLKTEALLDVKRDFLKVRFSQRITDDIVLSDIAETHRARYEKLFQATKLSSLQTKISALIPIIKNPYSVKEILEILEGIQKKTGIYLEDKLKDICKNNEHGKRMRYTDFQAACRQLKHE